MLALGWTLNYEMLFYVFFAAALLLPIRLGVLWLSVLMVGMALVGRLIDPQHVQIAFWTNPIILEFLFGVYVALIFRSGVRIGGGWALGLAAIGLLGFVHISTLWKRGRCGSIVTDEVTTTSCRPVATNAPAPSSEHTPVIAREPVTPSCNQGL